MNLGNPLHSRTTAVLAGAALLVGLGGVGGAVGAGMVTSADIKDNTIRTKDLHSSTRSWVNHSAVRRVPSGATVHGVVGGDFNNTTAAGMADWGVDASLPLKARNALTDEDVTVNVDGQQQSSGQTPATSADSAENACTGSPAHPTAPAGVVCVYVAGADNAVGVVGYSARFGTAGSPYGFKLKWDVNGTGDTFVDAVWAYTAP